MSDRLTSVRGIRLIVWLVMAGVVCFLTGCTRPSNPDYVIIDENTCIPTREPVFTDYGDDTIQCVTIDQADLWERGVSRSELDEHIQSNVSIHVSGAMLPPNQVFFDMMMVFTPVFDCSGQFIFNLGSPTAACFATEDFTPGAYDGLFRVTKVSGREFSYRWTFVVQAGSASD